MADPWYVPVQKIATVHAWARPNAADGMKQATNQFSPDWETAQGKNYIEGILSLAAVYFVLGALVFLAYSITNALACCCRSRGLKHKKRGSCESCCKAVFNPSGWFIVGVLVMIAVTSAAIADLGSFRSTVTTTVQSLNSFGSLLSKASTQTNGNLTVTLNALDGSLANLLATARQNNAPQQAIDQITAMQGYSASAILYTAQLGSQLNDTQSTFNSAIGGGDLDAKRIGDSVNVGAAAALGVFLTFLLLVSLSLIKKPCCALTFRFCNILLTLAFLGTFIFAGFLLMTGIVGADVCVNPSSAIASISNMTVVKQNAGGIDSTQTLLYLTSCQTQSGAILPPTSGAFLQLTQGQQEFTTLQSNFQTFAAQYSNQPAYTASISAVNGAIGTTQASLNTLNLYASCLPYNSIYQSMSSSLCNEGIASGVLNVWALSTAACVLMFVLATSAARLCWRHPGDPLDEDQEQGLTIVYNAAAGRTIPAAGGPATVGSAPNYSALPAGPASTSAAGSGKAAAYGAEWR